MSAEISQAQWEFHLKLVNDYELFARHIQKIPAKDLEEIDPDIKIAINALQGDKSTIGTIPFIFHPGQRKLHKFVTEMKKEPGGKVRAAMVKPRQVGWSTYIHGRIHWLCTQIPGLKAHIVSHSNDSTRKFLRRIKMLCTESPSTVTPGRPVDNSKEIIFDRGANISIATAGNPEAVRSDNSHILHASEEPFWDDAEAAMGALLPALSDGPGSEAYRESTSQGKGTHWHKFIMDTMAGENEWRLFFDGWQNHPKYQAPCPPGFQFDAEALEARRLVKRDDGLPLSDNQLFWRAMKIKSLGALWLFKQEFPSTVEESFQSSADTLINPDSVARARRTTIDLDPYAPLIMGVDPARTGDRTVIVFRQGKVIREMRVWEKKDGKMEDMRLVGIIARALEEGLRGKKVVKCFIDYAIGEGVASRLRELGWGRIVQVVNFAESPSEPRYLNKRAEMAANIRDWFGDTGEHCNIPDNDDFASDMLAIPDFEQASGSEKLKLPNKKDIKEAYGKSPDIFDAAMLTFAYPVAGEKPAELHQFMRNNFSHATPNEFQALLSDFEK